MIRDVRSFERDLQPKTLHDKLRMIQADPTPGITFPGNPDTMTYTFPTYGKVYEMGRTAPIAMLFEPLDATTTYITDCDCDRCRQQ